MARTELPNGIILPAEYSDDWYDDMTSNLSKLDDVIGSDADKLSAENVGAAALSNDYADLDNKPTIPTKTSDLTNDSNFVDTSNSAVASGITSAKVTSYDSHVADTDIHVTTADKNKWNNQTFVFRYSSTALTPSSTNANSLLDNTDNLKVGDKVIDSSGVLFSITAIDTQNSTFTIGTALVDLAVDSSVMHLSGNETASGFKTFDRYIQCNGGYIGNEASANARTELVLRSNRDTAGQSGIFLTKFRQNKAQGALSSNDVVYLTIDLLENSVRTNTIFRFNFRDFVNDVPQDIAFYPTGSKNSLGGDANGSSNNKWHLFNGINPGALSLPSGNARDVIDISSYITDLSGAVNLYTVPANGYLTFTFSNGARVQIYPISGGGVSSSWVSGGSAGIIRGFMPVLKNSVLRIVINATTMDSFVFIPCQGNV